MVVNTNNIGINVYQFFVQVFNSGGKIFVCFNGPEGFENVKIIALN